MRYPSHDAGPGRTTICISSQAGCAVGCPFCATGQAGFGRQLSAGEIVDQVLHWHREPWQALGPEWRPGAARATTTSSSWGWASRCNNADRVFTRDSAPQRPGAAGDRRSPHHREHLGVVPGIDRMIEELPQVNLAISLHAASDDLRDELVPINRKWPVAEVIAAGRRFAAHTGRRVSLEYVMIDGVNDFARARPAALAALATGWLTHVNLIPLNPTPGSRWSGTPGCGGARLRCGAGARWRAGDGARHARARDRGRLRAAACAAEEAADRRAELTVRQRR